MFIIICLFQGIEHQILKKSSQEDRINELENEIGSKSAEVEVISIFPLESFFHVISSFSSFFLVRGCSAN
jgi:hypothetical protein